MSQRGRWLVVVMFFAGEFFAGGLYSTYAVFFNPLLQYLHISRAQLALLPGILMVVSFAIAPLSGWLLDRIVGRWVVSSGLVLICAALLLYARAQSFRALVWATMVLAVGFSCSVAIVVPGTLVSKWFRDNRGLALGLVFAGYTLGSSTLMQFCRYVIAHYGWRSAYVAMSFPILLLVPLAIAVLGRPPSEDGSADRTREAAAIQLPGLEVRDALRGRSFWLVNAMELVFSFQTGVLIVHAVPQLVALGSGSAAAVSAVSLGFLLATFAKPIVGSMADRFGSRLILSVCFLGGGMGCLALVRGNVMPFTAIFVIGFVLAQVPIVVIQTLAVESYGPKCYGTLWGLNTLMNAGGQLLGPILAGAAFDRYATYTPVLVLCAILALASAGLPFGCVPFAPTELAPRLAAAPAG